MRFTSLFYQHNKKSLFVLTEVCYKTSHETHLYPYALYIYIQRNKCRCVPIISYSCPNPIIFKFILSLFNMHTYSYMRVRRVVTGFLVLCRPCKVIRSRFSIVCVLGWVSLSVHIYVCDSNWMTHTNLPSVVCVLRDCVHVSSGASSLNLETRGRRGPSPLLP